MGEEIPGGRHIRGDLHCGCGCNDESSQRVQCGNAMRCSTMHEQLSVIRPRG